jgi:hypothetical protein
MSTTSTGQHFVILSDGLGKWRRGDVVAAGILLEANCDIERLLTLKAMRNATEHEAIRQHVDIVTTERHMSYEHQLAEKDKEVTRLTTRVAELESQVAAGQHLAPPKVSGLNESALIEMKDRAIKDLEGKLSVAQRDLATSRAAAVAAQSELTALRAEASAHKNFANVDKADAKKDAPKPEAKKDDAKKDAPKADAKKDAPKPEAKKEEPAAPAVAPEPHIGPSADQLPPEVPGGLSRIVRRVQ